MMFKGWHIEQFGCEPDYNVDYDQDNMRGVWDHQQKRIDELDSQNLRLRKNIEELGEKLVRDTDSFAKHVKELEAANLRLRNSIKEQIDKQMDKLGWFES